MALEKVTQLPTVTSATTADIVYAVQGGNSVQETLAQILSLASSSIIQSFSGNPNGSVAGTIYNLLWDTLDNILYVCTSSGTTSTAVWTSTSQNNFTVVTTATSSMTANNGYIANRAGLITFTLPTTAGIGSRLSIIGEGSGGWSITFNTNQYIQLGAVGATPTSGSVSSTNRYDSLNLICTTANTVWSAAGAPEGNLTVV